MAIKDRLRGCDQFGTTAQLNFAGESSFGTVGGGAASLCLQTLLLAFFAIRIITVVDFEDPALSSYSIQVNRSSMTSPYSYHDYHQQLIFSFFDMLTFQPIDLDPRIGKI